MNPNHRIRTREHFAEASALAAEGRADLARPRLRAAADHALAELAAAHGMAASTEPAETAERLADVGAVPFDLAPLLAGLRSAGSPDQSAGLIDAAPFAGSPDQSAGLIDAAPFAASPDQSAGPIDAAPFAASPDQSAGPIDAAPFAAGSADDSADLEAAFRAVQAVIDSVFDVPGATPPEDAALVGAPGGGPSTSTVEAPAVAVSPRVPATLGRPAPRRASVVKLFAITLTAVALVAGAISIAAGQHEPEQPRTVGEVPAIR